MIQRINNLSFLLIISFFFSCKEKGKSNLESDQNSDQTKPIENIISGSDTNKNSDYTTWYYYFSTEKNKDYEDIKIYINNDSLRVTKADKMICQGEIVKEKQTFTSYFKSEKTGNEIKAKLKNEYELSDKNDLLVIMNAYGDITDKGCLFPFNEIFIIDDHLFLYDKGYQCFVLNNNSKSTTKSKGENFIKNSKITLPYNKKIDLNNVKYEKVNVKSIKGLDNYSCGDEQVRYLSLPAKGGINLILVPQDCADFPYNFQLLSIKNNEIISNLYVEGEWFEPENFKEKEITKFTIDEDYKITIITNSIKNDKTSLKEKLNYNITDMGVFKKI